MPKNYNSKIKKVYVFILDGNSNYAAQKGEIVGMKMAKIDHEDKYILCHELKFGNYESTKEFEYLPVKEKGITFKITC